MHVEIIVRHIDNHACRNPSLQNSHSLIFDIRIPTCMTIDMSWELDAIIPKTIVEQEQQLFSLHNSL